MLLKRSPQGSTLTSAAYRSLSSTPLNIPREDLVEATVAFPGGIPKAVRVNDSEGKEVPSQVENGKVLFLASTPSVGYSVYSVSPAQAANSHSALKVTESSLENARYRIKLNPGGDVSSIYDKSLNKELLSAPIRLAISNDSPKVYPAWNMDFDQEQAAPRAYVGRSGPHSDQGEWPCSRLSGSNPRERRL